MSNFNTIAQACYKDGGRAVYMARNISMNKLQEYYTDENCTPPPAVAPRESSLTELSGISIAPNPSDNELIIKFDESWSKSHVAVSILDATGKIVLNKMTSINGNFIESINVKALPSGIYIMTINNEEQSQTKKIVIKH